MTNQPASGLPLSRSESSHLRSLSLRGERGNHTIYFCELLRVTVRVNLGANAGRCILLRQSAHTIDHWQFIVDAQRITVGIEGPLTINDVETCIRSTLRGAGLFCLPRSLVMHYLEQGQMETVLDSHSVEVPGLSLYYPS
jgi:DNA-binding transcriptional LysR family regulator